MSELELLEFCQTVMALIGKWFVIPAPAPNLMKEVADSFYEAAADAVFKNGVFGFDNVENHDNVVINANLSGKSGATVAICRLFPSYKTLCTVPHYSFLRGKPWLLPVAWMYRIAKTIVLGKTKKCMEYVTDSFVHKEKIEKRSEELKRWGLR